MRFVSNTETTFNGGTAERLSAKQELIKLALISFFQNDFYEKEQEKLKRVISYVLLVPVEFTYALAKWSREYGLRTINHILIVEAMRKDRTENTPGSRERIRAAIDNLRRPDELMDIVGYYAISSGQSLNQIVLTNPLRLALKARLEKFSEYQLAKYKGTGDFNLYDLVNLTHPKSEAITKLMNGTLSPADTWEVELSKNGNTKESWTRLLAEEKLGALATIRNLRNMLNVGVDPTEYLKTINWKDVFPFQAIQALDVLANEGISNGSIYDVIMENIKTSFKNIAECYEGKIAIGVDLSGSMYGTQVSSLSSLDRAKMAIYYGELLREITGADLYFWGSACVPYTDGMSINEMYAIPGRQGWGTHISTLTDVCEGKDYDYLIVLTDEQISDNIKNVAKKQTVVWGLHDYANTITKWSNCTYFTGYNDLMWKIGKDLNDLNGLEKSITQ